MSFNVYTNGNFEHIVGAYNALAMMYDNSSGIYYVAGIVSMLALLGWGINRVFDTRSSPTHNFFVGWVLFLALAGPLTKSTVVITSTRSGNTQTIDNVPFVIALGGSLSSSVLSSITSLAKQAFSVVYPVGSPYEVYGTMDPLQAIVKLNTMDWMTSDLCTYSNRYLCDNYIQYYMNCVERDQLTGGAKQETEDQAILNADPSSLINALQVKYDGWSSKWKTTTATYSTTKTCSAAWASLKTDLTSVGFQNLIKKAEQENGIKEIDIQNGSTMLTNAAINDSYTIGMARFQHQLINLAKSKAMSGSSVSGDDVLVAQTEFQAKEQRNTKMATMYSMFNDLAPALITFIEFFTLFIAPVVLSLLVTGKYGLSALMNYLLLMVFTNLWPLCAVGVESYVQWAILTQADGGYSTNAFSINGIPNITDRVQTYLAVGSAMMAAIPTLSMYVITRNAGSIGSLAGGMINDAPVNAHYISPNLSTAPDAGASRSGMSNMSYDDKSNTGAVALRQGIGQSFSTSGTTAGAAQHQQSLIHSQQSQISAQMGQILTDVSTANTNGGSSKAAGEANSGVLTKSQQAFENAAHLRAAQDQISLQDARGKTALQQTSDTESTYLGLDGGLGMGNGKPGGGGNPGGASPSIVPKFNLGANAGMNETFARTSSDSTTQANNVTVGQTGTDTQTASSGDGKSVGAIKSHQANDNYQKFLSITGGNVQAAQKLTGLAQQYSALEAQSEAVANIQQTSMDSKLQSSSDSYKDVAVRWGNTKQEDITNALSQETKDKLMKNGIIDSTGSFSGESGQTWLKERERAESFGVTGSQADNLATANVLLSTAKDLTSRGSAADYAAAADIYRTMNEGDKSGKFQGAEDQTLARLEQFAESMSQITGRDALNEQASQAGLSTVDAKTEIDTIRGKVESGSDKVISKSDTAIQEGSDGADQSRVDVVAANANKDVKKKAEVNRNLGTGDGVGRGVYLPSVLAEAGTPSSAPQPTNVVRKGVTEEAKKAELVHDDAEAGRQGKPKPSQPTVTEIPARAAGFLTEDNKNVIKEMDEKDTNERRTAADNKHIVK